MLARTRSIVALVGVVGGLMGTADLAHAAPPAPQAHKGARITWVRGIDAERCVGRAGLEEDVKATGRYWR